LRQSAAVTPVKQTWEEAFALRRQWWSLQPLRQVSPPGITDAAWSTTAIDRFLQARLESEQVIPSALADPATLLRRVTLVLTGLPPSLQEVEAFTAAAKLGLPRAYSGCVDRLLATPAFGERFARHWLDVVRFTETHGNEWNYDAAYAWRYRDYVIRAFNDDLPYDQFVREHIAGDLLAQPRWNASGRFNESAIGTAFYRFGEVNHDSCVQFGVIGYDIVDNQLDTLTKAFQATTVACARCHDHKMDAVSARDYHALLGVLRSSRSVMQTLDSPEVNRELVGQLRELKQPLRAELAAVWRTEAVALTPEKLHSLVLAAKDKAPDVSSPLHAWFVVGKLEATKLTDGWSTLAAAQAEELARRSEFNRTNFTVLADFRSGQPTGWFADGLGLRGEAESGGDFVVAHEGEKAVKALLPAGIFTFSLSDRLNGALRSPTLRRSQAKVSFEVMGGRFSLARLVFNNCQLNYNHQHSIHHDEWSWVTIDFPEKTEALYPYVELLTFWDNPKFPDPLGTLGKDTENQRGPYAEHAQNPRTWWGLRRIVQHDVAEPPKTELSHLAPLFAGGVPVSVDEVAARYAAIARDVVEAFAANRASDDQMRWLDWLMQSGLLSNSANASPRLADLTAKYRTVENRLEPPTTMPVLADEGDALDQPIFARGDPTRPGEKISPGYVRALTPPGFLGKASGSGRRELAQLIARADNPLTARVLVNRVWQWIFGRGLVATPDDFGHLGENPSHPELLDYLAGRFVAEGWSVKQLVRAVVLSRAFQSAAAPTEEARERDPDNRLLSHWSVRRAEAEVIRDSLLAVSGRLDSRRYGPSVVPFREKADPEKRLFTGPLDGDGRRSLYLKFQLMEAPHFLSAFNLPGGKVTQGRRDASNVPAQSLALLNDPLVVALADQWARHLVVEGRGSVPERVKTMFHAAVGRPPNAMEHARLVDLVHRLSGSDQTSEVDLLSDRTVWKDTAHTLFNLKEFIFIP